MTDRTPIPPAEFADAVDRLDRDALAEFVGRLEAATSEDATVDVEPPIVTVREGDTERRVVVAPDEIDAEDVGADGADAVVVGSTGPTGGIAAEVQTPDDLRRRLLYALPPDTAESVAEWLGVPARAASYEQSAGEGAGDAPEPASDPGGNGSEPPPPTGSPDTTGERGGVPGETDQSPADNGPGGPDPSTGTSTPNGGPDRLGSTGGSRSMGSPSAAQTTLVVAVVAVLLGGVGSVVYVAELSPDGDAGAFADTVAVETDGLSESDIRRRSRGPIDESGAVTSPETTGTPPSGGGGTGMPSATDGVEPNRNVRPVLTCNRSPLLVVQIQMNALQYNNNTTNDGIRTVRRFASPQNRQAIETFDEFVRTIQNPMYNPLLSYDSVEYTPSQSSGDYAQIRVVTRENDSVTGQYYFRLRQVEGGQYDGCWMTDAVVATSQVTNDSGLTVAHPEGRPTAS